MSTHQKELIELRQRSTRASEQQKYALVKYFEDNPNAIRIVNGVLGDQKARQVIWIELAHRLNLIDGTLKSTAKWSKYWNDIIIYTRNCAKNVIGGFSKSNRAPTKLDEKILCITGQEHLFKKWSKCIKEANFDEYEVSSSPDLNIYEENVANDPKILDSEKVITEEYLLNQDEFLEEIQPEGSVENKHDIKIEYRECHSYDDAQDHEKSQHEPKKRKLDNIEVFDVTEENPLNGIMAELPKLLYTVADSLATISQAICKFSNALETYNSNNKTKEL